MTGTFNTTQRTAELRVGGGGVDVANTANSFAYDGNIFGPGGLTKNGTIVGPAAPLAITFTGPLSGAGSFTGNIRILDSFAPGNSPAAISFENVSFGDFDGRVGPAAAAKDGNGKLARLPALL